MEPSDLTPYGFCQCGCGMETEPYPQNHAAKGWIAGEPRRFIHGHNGSSSGPPPIFVLASTGCWLWDGKRNDRNYGVVDRGGQTQLAHRWVYERLVGPIPAGHVLDHLCRTEPCVNPDHLEPVSDAINTRRGNATKLNESDVATIRALRPQVACSEREFSRILAPVYGVDPHTVRAVVRGLSWSTPKLRAVPAEDYLELVAMRERAL